MTNYTFDENIVSDLHKDARGYRPTEAFWNAWNFQDDEGKQTAWDILIDELNESMDRERRMAARAVKDFESDVNLNIALGAGDRQTALRWMTQTEEFFNDQCIEHWVWERGILFTDYGRELFDELKTIITFKEYA